MAEAPTIVIAGAGIGGLATALALHRTGFRPVVVERATMLSDIGAGIQIAPNAARVLNQFGLGAAIAERATEPAGIVIRSGTSGRTLTTLPAAAFQRRYGVPYRVIHRADLQAVLADAVRGAGIDLRLGTTITAIHTRAGHVEAGIETSGARDAIAAAAVIGADGVRSAVRTTIPGAATTQPTRRTAWRATIAADPATASKVGLWLGPGAHLVHYPIRGSSMINVVAIIDAPPTDTAAWDTPGDPATLAARFAAWAEPASAIIGSASAWRTFPIVAVDPAGQWVEGRTALMGDAAHAMEPYLAQGAAMALEDAATLAAYLSGTQDVPAALRAYEAGRKPRVARVAAASSRTGARYHAIGPMQLARDAALAVGGPALMFAMNDWIYRWRPPAGASSPG